MNAVGKLPDPSTLDQVLVFEHVHRNALFTDAERNFYIAQVRYGGEDGERIEELEQVTPWQAIRWYLDRQPVALGSDGDIFPVVEILFELHGRGK